MADYPKGKRRTHLKTCFKDLNEAVIVGLFDWTAWMWSQEEKVIAPLLLGSQRTKTAWVLALLEAVNDIEMGIVEANSAGVPGIKLLLEKYRGQKRLLYGGLELLYWWGIGLDGGSTISEVTVEADNAGLHPRSVCDTLARFESIRIKLDDHTRKTLNNKTWAGPAPESESTPAVADAPSDKASGSEAPLDELAVFNRVTAALALDDLDTAENLLQALVRQRKSARYLYNLGYVLYRRTRYADALNVYVDLINIEPRMVEAYLNAFKTCLMMGDHAQARRFVDAATKIAPEMVEVGKARAQYFDAIGDHEQYWAQIAKLPDDLVFKRPVDNNVNRLKENASVLIGERRVSVWMAIFPGDGLRTVFVGYKSPTSALPRPRAEFKWTALQQNAQQNIHIETLDENDDQVAMIGYRVTGMDEPAESAIPVGYFEANFYLDDLGGLSPDSHGGLFLVNQRGILLERKQLFVRDLLSVSEGDLWDVRDDIFLGPSSGPTTPNPLTAKVFLCYAREDIERVTLIHQGLVSHGIDSYMDKELKVGEPYEKVLHRRIQQSDFAIVFISARSTTKTGHFHVELRQILKESERRPLGETFILPVKLNACQVPDEIGAFHWLEPSDDHIATIHALVTSIRTHFPKRQAQAVRNPSP